MDITVTDPGTSLIDLVRRTRQAQKQYFRTRDYLFLQEARELERELDKELDILEIQKIREQARKDQPELFPGKN